VRVELSVEAQAQVERIDAWWREHRPAAPSLFAEELEEALRRLAEAPASTVRYPPRPGVRRLLLPRTRHHLYVLEEGTRVHVVAVWSAHRGRGPRL
jgi:plasmid stabilization system protein ParE